jgi:hypothetical protein
VKSGARAGCTSLTNTNSAFIKPDITIMSFANYMSIFAILGANLAWGILNLGSVARSPLRISLVGLAICASGFFLQTQVHRMEHVPASFVVAFPFFSASRDTLDFINKMTEVVIYAVGGGIITSALVLRAQLRFQREIKEQEENKIEAIANIEQLERDLKFADADARIRKIDSEQQISQILISLELQEKKLKAANRILRSAGC